MKRPNKRGKWWFWREDLDQWEMHSVSIINKEPVIENLSTCKDGLWVEVVPPPKPEKPA